ncbi:MAG: precorrin-2 C(20)-methyltransferase [Lachnospiraceae bacterium]|nr:precorrin-2 C(20)-methyltransferase [Lachnospiraceae bacterium]
MTGILYGISVGPGDPELMTLKAVRRIRECDILVVPAEDYQESVAYKIALGAVEELREKQVVGVSMPMTRDPKILAEHHRRAADRIEAWLEEGRNVGFLTLGDVTVYSTYIYVHKLVAADGYRTELISGVPSFCAAAARLGIGLAEQKESLHVIPASGGIEEALELPGTRVFMKAGKQLGAVKQQLKASEAEVWMVENCGMPGERIFRSADAIDENAGYYSLLIAKEVHG